MIVVRTSVIAANFPLLSGACAMKLSAPTQVFFLISLALAVIGLLGFLGVVSAVAAHAFWLMTAGYAVLALACLLKGM
jgi:hypothetical protein